MVRMVGVQMSGLGTTVILVEIGLSVLLTKGVSSNGRTPVSHTGNRGPNPLTPTITL